MKSRILPILLVTVALACLVAPASAKPLYCNYQCYPPYYNGPDDWCTCPPGSLLYGDIIHCYDYFYAYCSGAFTTPDPSDKLLAQIFAPAPEEETSSEAESSTE